MTTMAESNKTSNFFRGYLRFLLMLRGDCTFVKKVTNAQQEGNQLAIIMDNVIEKTQKIVMANDGYASHINIPSIFIG